MTRSGGQVLRIATALGLLICLSVTAHADWDRAGVPISVGEPFHAIPVIAADPVSRDLLVWWCDARAGRQDADAYGQLLHSDASIANGWPLNGILLASHCDGRNNLRSDGQGGFFNTFAGVGNGTDIRGQWLDATGNPRPGWSADGNLLVGIAGNQDQPRTTFVSGGAFVVWEDRPTNQIRGMCIATDGTVSPGWQTNGTLLNDTGFYANQPDCATDGAGGIYVVWVEEPTAGSGRYIRLCKFTVAGQLDPTWPPGGIRLTQPGIHVQQPRLAVDGNGGVYCVWADYRSAPPGSDPILHPEYLDIYAHHVLSTGVLYPGWSTNGIPVCTVFQIQEYPSAVSDGVGGLIAGWLDYRTFASANFVSRLNPDGTRAAGWSVNGVAVTPMQSGSQTPGILVSDGGTGVFCGFRDDSHARCLVQHLRGDASIDPLYGSSGRPVSDPSLGGSQVDISIAADYRGGVYAAWTDSRGGGSKNNIWAQHFDGDLPTGVMASLITVDAGSEQVRLVWSTEYAGRIVLQRRQETTEWRAIAHVNRDGSGRIDVSDSEVTAGERYAYRLGADDGSAVSAEVWVPVPAYALALRGFAPNPALGHGAAVAFTLPRQALGALSLYDVSGREVCRYDVSHLGPGHHTLPIQGSLRAGVYWVNLQHGDRRLTSKGIVLR